MQLMKSAGLVDDSPLQEAACTTSFDLALFQNELVGPRQSLDTLVFCEFVEALSQVALQTIENTRSGNLQSASRTVLQLIFIFSGLNDAQKIRMAFDSVSTLHTNLFPPHK